MPFFLFVDIFLEKYVVRVILKKNLGVSPEPVLGGIIFLKWQKDVEI